MKKVTVKFIVQYFVGALSAEELMKKVNSFLIPKKIPRRCFGFRFAKREEVTDGHKRFVGDLKYVGPTYFIGEIVNLKDIPDNNFNRTLRSNIEFNSPTNQGVRTHLGTWQCMQKNVEVLPASRFVLS